MFPILLMLLAVDKPLLIQSVSGSSNNRIEAKTGGLVARRGEPAVAFALLRLGKGKRTLPYFALIRYGADAGGQAQSSDDVMLEDRKASMKHTLSLDNKTVLIAHTVEVSPDATRTLRESLTIDSKAIDLARGRVFLIDLTEGSAKWEQKKLDLPAEIADPMTAKDTTDLVGRVLADLIKQDKNVKAFLETK
ncbi:MAG: hypothetical protein EBV06_11980 [Planctomycetia bacterium]|nr:hypothetical protein [Planctomycetia bacterium]